MPIFELDEGHPILVQPMQPTAGSFTPDSTALVTDHLASLLGEQLFTVRARHGDDPGPHLLALDAAGQPVVVDVVQVLDGENLVLALQHAGVAGRLSRAELLRTYERGAQAFDTDFQAFRDQSPLTAAQAAPRTGARLVLVCADVDPQVADAIAFLREPGRQVEVLQLGVVQGADGRRFVDVSPLAVNQLTRRTVEPASQRLVRSKAPIAELPVPIVGPWTASAPRTPGGSVTAPTQTAVPTPLPSPAPADHERSRSGSLLPDPRALPALAALARGGRATATLVWFRQRRGQRLLATLRPDGLIELPNGRLHADPDDAAAEAANTEGTVDGWRTWRLGEGGPTLAEAAGAR